MIWVCNQKVWRPLASRMLWYYSCLHNHLSCCWIQFFNINLKYTPQQHIFNMPTEIFLLQNINGYNDTVETSEGSGSDNTRHCWQSILWWNKVTTVKLKHMKLLNQNRAMLTLFHLSHFSSVPALLLHHLLPLFPTATSWGTTQCCLFWHVY